MIAAVVLLAAFVLIERRRRAPMLDLSLFRRPAFDGASIVAFALSGSIFAMFLYLTLYLQNILGLSPLGAGLRLLTLSLAILVTSFVAGRLTTVVPVRLLMGAGLALVGVSLLLMRGADRDVAMDAPAPRVYRRRRRRRPDQPTARLNRDRRRPAPSGGHGFGDQ